LPSNLKPPPANTRI